MQPSWHRVHDFQFDMGWCSRIPGTCLHYFFDLALYLSCGDLTSVLCFLQQLLQDVPTVGWTVEDRPAGEWQTQRNLSYVLIYNSSHMVPYDVPLVSLDMINRFIGIDHRLQPFSSRLETDPVDDLPPKGGKQDIDQGKSSYSSVKYVMSLFSLIVIVIVDCLLIFYLSL